MEMDATPPQPDFIHAKTHDERCEICTSDKREYFEKLYIQREPIQFLENTFHWSRTLIHKHGKALKLYGRRMDNTNAIRRMVLEQGLEQLAEGKMEITVKDLLRAGFDTDKIKGRIVDKVQINHPKVLLIGAIPLPGGGKVTANEAQKLEKPQRALLLPGKVTVVEETAVEEE